jgi:hypothetical protein
MVMIASATITLYYQDPIYLGHVISSLRTNAIYNLQTPEERSALNIEKAKVVVLNAQVATLQTNYKVISTKYSNALVPEDNVIDAVKGRSSAMYETVATTVVDTSKEAQTYLNDAYNSAVRYAKN